MKTLFIIVLSVPLGLWAQIPVTDVANLAANQTAHAANIAKWVESINNLRTQIDQLNQQINIQGDIRKWSGNPTEAGASVVLDGLGQPELVREYGRGRSAILGLVRSLDSLGNTASGNYRAISALDLDGNEVQRDPFIYRRYAVLDGVQANADDVKEATQEREQELQEEIARTLDAIKSASTDAEVQKLSAKLAALNGQLRQIEATRQREADEVVLQKIANDARLEQERLAAAELAAKDDYLANQRVSSYLKTLRVRRNVQP